MTLKPAVSALDFLLSVNTSETEECVVFPYDQKRVYYLMSQRTPQWVATSMSHGPRELGQVPVRTCKTRGCINGLHHKWGSQAEANATRRKAGMSGENNPGAKMTELEVAQLRCVKWGGGYYKWHAANAAGISMRGLAAILKRYSWPDVEPYVSSAPKPTKPKEPSF